MTTTEENNRLDKEWKQAILKRDNYVCQVCGKKGNNPHHIIPRMFKDICREEWNGILLCVSCHMFNKYSAHKNPLWWYSWMQQHRPFILEMAKDYLEKQQHEKT